MVEMFAAIGLSALEVFNPVGGRGLGETVIGFAIVGAFVASLFCEVNEQARTVLVTLTSCVVSFYFGRKTVEYNPPKKDSEDSPG